MKSSYKPISELVERVDIRNSDGNDDLLMGLSIDKCFIRSVANTVGTDLTKYKVICKNQFAVSLMQVSRDSKIPVACFRECDRAIMSPAYSIFQVSDESVVLPDYLDMWFKRPEFDREAAFIAVGGVRGSMPWEEFARIEVCVPALERQREIVDAYKVVNERIRIKQLFKLTSFCCWTSLIIRLLLLTMFIRRFWNKPRTSKSTLNNPHSSERSKSWAAQSC